VAGAAGSLTSNSESRCAGGSTESAVLIGPNGHLDAFTAIGQGAENITAFLSK
jgi:hypothetical protein